MTLKDLQSLVFYAGANAILVGDYLTTKGRSADEDRALVESLGLTVEAS